MRGPLTLALVNIIVLRHDVPAAASQTGLEEEVEAELIRRHGHVHGHTHGHDHHRRHHHRHHSHRSNATLEIRAAANRTWLTERILAGGNSTAKTASNGSFSTLRAVAGGGVRAKNTVSKAPERDLANKESPSQAPTTRGLEVNGPLPPDFNQLFSEAVAEATKSVASDVKVLSARRGPDGTFHLKFQAPAGVADAAQEQAADPDSPLATGRLHDYLVAKEATHSTSASEEEEEQEDDDKDGEESTLTSAAKRGSQLPRPAAKEEDSQSQRATSVDLPMQQGIDVDAELPYGQLEPFGREDTAQELTERSITESNEMVDQLERAEVAEEKRAVFRALTRLRGAALTAFDGIARSQTGTIDNYNKLHRWRSMHPLRHLADEEGDVSKWAFPDS